MENVLNIDTLIVFLSALAAAASFVAVVIPLMNRSEKKERVRSVIEKKKKALFDQTKEQAGKAYKADEKGMSASQSVAASFKVRQLLGDRVDQVKMQMQQAGYRNPNAPIKYMIARVVIPVILVLFTMLIFSKAEKEVSGAVVLLVILGAAGLGYMLPRILLKNQIVKRAQDINLAFPDALDMMLICVQGGIGLEQTVNRIAEEISENSPILAEELGILSAEMAMLNDRRKALQDFARRVGSGAAKSFATALIQAEQYGTSVSQAMRVMSDELRDQRMAMAEQKAASLPPKLTVPMILFFLPVLFVIILVPAVMQAMDNLK